MQIDPNDETLVHRSVRLRADQVQALKKLAAQRDRTLGYLVREAVQAMIDAGESK